MTNRTCRLSLDKDNAFPYFSHDYENGKQMLKRAEEFVTSRNSEASRYWFLSASGITTLLIFFYGLLFWLFRDCMICYLGQLVFILVMSGVAGAIGALLSVIMRLGSTNLDSAAGKNLHYQEAFYRIIAGSLSGVLIALVVKLGIIIPIFSKINETNIAMVLAAFIAGASERWAPSIISQVEGGKTGTK